MYLSDIYSAVHQETGKKIPDDSAFRDAVTYRVAERTPGVDASPNIQAADTVLFNASQARHSPLTQDEITKTLNTAVDTVMEALAAQQQTPAVESLAAADTASWSNGHGRRHINDGGRVQSGGTSEIKI